MPKMATKAADNVFYKARIAAASWNDRLGSREGASEVTGIDRTRLANIELGTINPHPEEVLMLSDTYNAPELQNHFCSHLCPLGIGTISPIELEELERVTLQLISAMKSLPEVKDGIIDIAADGVIDASEKPRIDAYLAKAENDLYEQLTMEGYLKAKESLNTVDEIEEVVTKLLEDNADDLLKELADAIDLETFFKDNWPKFKNKSKLSQDLFDVFHTQFSTIMPMYVEAYVQKTDAELTVTKLTKRTTDWISSWSSDLADIMKLDTETEIEAVLKKGLNDGKGINDVANIIADSGIRSPGYRARRVALTEVLRAHGYAQLESYIQSPAVEEKMWKHTGAYRNDPRQNHVDMDGVRVPKGQPFTLIGADGNTYYPMTPRDVCLPPRESVNCHCLLQPVVSEEVLGLSLEERQALQAQAIAEDDGEWEKELDAQNKARAGINEEDYT